MEQCQPMGVCCYIWHPEMGAEVCGPQAPLTCFCHLLVFFAYWPLGSALSPNLWVHYTVLFWGFSAEIRKSTYCKCCTVQKTFCRKLQFFIQEPWSFWLKGCCNLASPSSHLSGGVCSPYDQALLLSWLGSSGHLLCLIFSDALFIWALIKGSGRTGGIF